MPCHENGVLSPSSWYCLLAMNYTPHKLPFGDVFETKKISAKQAVWA